MNTSRLLLVEDDDDVAEIVIEILDGEGYRVDRAADGSEGLLSLRTKATPSLVLLDWTLPKVSGPEMARTMQRELGWSRIPIVLLTASEGLIKQWNAGTFQEIGKMKVFGPIAFSPDGKTFVSQVRARTIAIRQTANPDNR